MAIGRVINLATVWLVAKILKFFKVRIFSFRRNVFVQFPPSVELRNRDYIKLQKIITYKLDAYESIALHINAYGGEVTNSFVSLANNIRSFGNRITATTFGADSVPALIFLSASNRIISRCATIGLHGPIAKAPVASLKRDDGGLLYFGPEHSKLLLHDVDIFRHMLSAFTRLSCDKIESILAGDEILRPGMLRNHGAVEHVV